MPNFPDSADTPAPEKVYYITVPEQKFMIQAQYPGAAWQEFIAPARNALFLPKFKNPL